MGTRIFFMATVLAAILGLTVLLTLQSQAQGDDEQAVLAGKSLYYGAWGASPFACIYCHSNFDEQRLDDGYLRPGHSLWNSANRQSFYNSAYAGKGDIPLIRAVNTCIAGFLKAKPLPASDPKMRALLAYIRSISLEPKSSPITISRAKAIPEIDGDPRRGEILYKSACILCHRQNGSAPELMFVASTALAASKIRGLTPPGGSLRELPEWSAPMPFFSMERLGDQQAADILSYWEYTQYLREQEQLSAQETQTELVEITESPGFTVQPTSQPTRFEEEGS